MRWIGQSDRGNTVKYVPWLLLCLVLCGCESYYATNAEKQYLRSHNGAAVQVPPPLTAAEINHFYDLPTQNQAAEINTEPPKSK